MEQKEKEAKIHELEKKRAKLIDEAHELYNEIEKLKLGDSDFTGKFINISGYGSMYVTWQKVERSASNKSEVFLQGFANYSNVTGYLDSFFLGINAMHNWYIPIETFRNLLRNNEIKVISKEDFIKEMHDNIEKFNKEADGMLELLITENIKNK